MPPPRDADAKSAERRTAPAASNPTRPVGARPAPPSVASRPTRAPRIAPSKPKRRFPVVAVSAVVVLLAGGGAAWSGGLIPPTPTPGTADAATMRLAQVERPAGEDGAGEAVEETPAVRNEAPPPDASADAASEPPPAPPRDEEAPVETTEPSREEVSRADASTDAEPARIEEPDTLPQDDEPAVPDAPTRGAAADEEPSLPSLVTAARLPAEEVEEPAVEVASSAPPVAPAVVRAPDPDRVYGVEELDRAPELTNGSTVMRAIQRDYRAGATGLGTVHMNVTFVVQADGRVDPESVFVPQESLTSLVQRGLSRARFRPAMLDGRPVRARVTLPLTWVANEEE